MVRTKRQVIALGGGSSSRVRASKMARYLLDQTGSMNPRVCFVPTATGDDAAVIRRLYRAFESLRCRRSHLPLFHNTVVDKRRMLLAQDLIYVGGGNTRNMLVLWKLWGVDRIIRQAYERGTVLAGPSAGGMAWFSAGLTDSYPILYRPLKCLGWLKGSFCPHLDGEPKRRPQYLRMVQSGALPAGYGVDDCVGLHFVDEQLERVVSTRRRARAYRVSKGRSRPAVVEIVPDLL